MYLTHLTREIEQENLLLYEINKLLDSTKEGLEANVMQLQTRIKEKKFNLNESEQQNKILHAIIEENAIRKVDRRHILIASLSIALVISMLIIIDPIRKESSSLRTGYFTYDLKGDQIETTSRWDKPEGIPIRVYIENLAMLPDNKIQIVKDAIYSKEIIRIDDSLTHKAPSGEKSNFYLGWNGVVGDQSLPLVGFASSKIDADVIVSLIRTKNMDGYSGWTESTVKNDEILHSQITIFNSGELSEQSLGTITRHEFGHVLGLGHSTDPDDLMSPTITTSLPYISECDRDGLISLYTHNKSVHTCEK